MRVSESSFSAMFGKYIFLRWTKTICINSLIMSLYVVTTLNILLRAEFFFDLVVIIKLLKIIPLVKCNKSCILQYVLIL